MENVIIKEKLNELVSKLENLGLQAEQFKKTREGLINLIESQKSINNSYVETLKKCDDYVLSINKELDENIINKFKIQLERTKELLAECDERNKEISEIINPLVEKVKENFDIISKDLSITQNEVSNVVLKINNFHTNFKDEITNTNSLIVSGTNGISKSMIEFFVSLENLSNTLSKNYEILHQSIKDIYNKTLNGLEQNEEIMLELAAIKKSISKSQNKNLVFFIISAILSIAILLTLILK